MDFTKAKQIYNRLKIDMHNAYYTETMVENLENFREEASTYLIGPAQYERLSFLKICRNLEGEGVIGCNDFQNLKILVQSTSGGATQLLEMINKAERDIQCLSGNVRQTREVVPVQVASGVAVSDAAGNFHKSESTVVSYNEIQAIGKADLDKSVGLIKIKKEDGHLMDAGTGFRVGEHYLMTAYHVFVGIIEKVWQRAIRKVHGSQRKEELCQKIESLFKISQDQIAPLSINPRKQPLPFGELFKHLDDNGVDIEVFETLFREGTSVEFGLSDGIPTAGKFHFEYDIPFADAAHDVLVLKIRKGESTLPPPLALEEDIVDIHAHLFGYPQSMISVDLKSDIKCSIYVDNEVLQRDVNKAIEWWKDERNRSVKDAYAVCRYAPQKRCTDTGRMFLQTSKQFEHNASGSPVVAIIKNRLVVQLMYLRGYPEFCYDEKNYPPKQCLQYLFEAGVAMPVVTQLLRECCPNIMTNNSMSQS